MSAADALALLGAVTGSIAVVSASFMKRREIRRDEDERHRHHLADLEREMEAERDNDTDRFIAEMDKRLGIERPPDDPPHLTVELPPYRPDHHILTHRLGERP